MNIDFKLPELGENIESGDIVKVLVHEGETVQPNQGVFELETDKAIIEVPCSVSGSVTKIHVAEGDKVKVGQVLLTLESAEAKAAETSAPSKAEKDQGATEQGATGVSPVPSPEKPSSGEHRQDASGAPSTADASLIPAGPVARRLARELGIDLTSLTGSGPHGRITPEDVKGATGRSLAGAKSVSEKGATADLPSSVVQETREPVVPPGEPGEDAWGPIRRDRISQIRRTIARHMSHSATTIPHVTHFDDADVTELDALRRGVPQGYLAPGVKLTIMPLVLRAVALSLRQHPALNASLDEENDQVVYKQYVNLGVAVDTPRGLVVPVIRNADQMSVAELAEAIGILAEKARNASFAIEDIRGGTFTISNLGAVGGTYATPIINHPEVAILLLGRSRWTPQVRDGRIEPRLMMPLSLSYDHRLVDGGAAGRFLNQVIGLLQTPGKILF